MVTAVWVVGGPGDREDLRHSLRSVATNAPFITEAWVVGDVPTWFNGVSMALEPKALKFENQRASLTAFANHPGAPDEFALFNDDMFLIEPVESLPVIRNKKSASQWNLGHPKHGPNCWVCAVQNTAAWVANKTGTDPFLYENHTPLMFSTRRLRDVLNTYPTGQSFAVGEVFPIAGIHGPGHTAGNAKVKGSDPIADKLTLPMPYLSGNPDSWDGHLGRYIREMFPRPCCWER